MRRATRTRASPAYPASRPDWGRCDASRNGRPGRGKRARWTWMQDPDGGSRERVRLARPEHHDLRPSADLPLEVLRIGPDDVERVVVHRDHGPRLHELHRPHRIRDAHRIVVAD